ncbi:MAG: S-layer homology domain-containing protein, partial [Oscillospiraceae bacterium]|nr:S-layer homology domain-containing protein [Oscillospiraceae bacterium]
TYVSSSEMKAETREALMALAESALKDVGSDALKKSVKKMVKSYGKSAGEELAEDIYTLMDVGTLLKECLNMDDDELETMVTKALVSTGSSISVDVLMSLVGLEAAKKAFDYLGVVADAGNFLEFFNNYCDSMTGGASSVAIALYAPGSSGRYDVTDQTFVFNDVSSETSGNGWYYEAVYWAYDQGITKGTSDTVFSPDIGCTRAQFATFLYRLAQASGVDVSYSIGNPFSDVSEAAHQDYYASILWCYQNGITTGTSSTTFDPDGTITRAQAVTMLARYEVNVMGGTIAEVTETSFSDVSDSWAISAVQWAYENGITDGTGGSLFSPNDPCTRAMMVTFLYRYVTGES